ncbi:MAG: hypothetical protein ABEH64_13180 [Salinirussus sp.]
MEEVFIELAEPLILVAYTLLSAALTLAGLAIEYLGLSGQVTGTPRLWAIFMGLVILGFGYLVARDKVLPVLQSS